MKKYIVRLDPEERIGLQELVRVGKAAAYRIRHANVLLAVDVSQGSAKLTDADAAAAFGVSVRSIEYLRERCVEAGLEAALERKKRERPSVERMFDGEKEAQLIAVACGAAPQGRARWTLQLLADRMVALKVVEHCSPQTVGRTLKKTNSSLGERRCGASLRNPTRNLSARWKTC